MDILREKSFLLFLIIVTACWGATSFVYNDVRKLSTSGGLLLFLFGPVLGFFVWTFIKPTKDLQKKSSRFIFFLSVIVFIYTTFYVIYTYQFDYINYVFACPKKYTSKCYKVKASLEKEFDGESTVTTLKEITFPNTGSVYFDYCNGGVCYDTDNEAWEISDAENKAVLKVEKNFKDPARILITFVIWTLIVGSSFLFKEYNE